MQIKADLLLHLILLLILPLLSFDPSSPQTWGAPVPLPGIRAITAVTALPQFPFSLAVFSFFPLFLGCFSELSEPHISSALIVEAEVAIASAIFELCFMDGLE